MLSNHEIKAKNNHKIFSYDSCIPQRVAQQAIATPDVIALISGNNFLSYGELNRQANRLAHRLIEHGASPNVLIACYLDRSLDLVIALLAILKTGAAYVPLDPAYPAERVDFMLTDTEAPILLTRSDLAQQLPATNATVICLDTPALLLQSQAETDLAVTVEAENLAYVIYTSGSTGQPKGVEVTHDSLLNLIRWHQQAFAVTAQDKATQVASPAFDATGWELWPYLTTGASVTLIEKEVLLSPVTLRDWLIAQHITIAFLPTALAESVMTLRWPSKVSLRYLLTGADTLRHYPAPELPFALINNYGPTEATVVTTSGRVWPVSSQQDEAPAIGRPIANMEVLLLDEQLRRVPTGSAGELYIGGVGLAKGYLKRPELTAGRFIRHPFSNDPQTRLYKTGDLARELPDGQLAFLGRVDQQIKLRGYRIEPEEIMAALNAHPAIQTSLVVAREDTPGDKRLVAYVVFHSGMTASHNALHDALVARLPDYMIPSIYIPLETMPLTPNGKVDQAALPPPAGHAAILREQKEHTEDTRDTGDAPGTPTEETLQTIIAPLLGLEQIGRNENVFLLGGHSLFGTQVIMRIAETFGIEITLRTLFNAPTIAQLAQEIERLLLTRIEAMSDDEVDQMLAK